jgi:hypothetical protein
MEHDEGRKIRWVGAAVPLAAALVFGGAVTSCNQHPVEFVPQGSVLDVTKPTPISEAAAMDILWVIDNSGSMCQEQKVLRENFRSFIAELAETNLDFQIGITTTHAPGTDPETGQLYYKGEPVAREGELQSTPQPVPGNNPTCWNSPGSTNYDLIRETQKFAVDNCLADGQTFDTNFSTDEIQCALTRKCSGAGINPAMPPASLDRNGDGLFDVFDLYPSFDQYKELPKVLARSDYAGDDRTLDDAEIQQLVDDFACASLVGTRGYGFEKGLQALQKATSVEMTQEGAPNAGFIRPDAGFTAVFVTDENDCSHDGSLDERSSCGGAVCEFANHPDAVDSPLFDPGEVKKTVMENLAASKGVETFSEERVLMASIHGAYDRFTGEILTEAECTADPTQIEIEDSCSSPELGTAFSGDRYERFLWQFRNFYPAPPEDSDILAQVQRADTPEDVSQILDAELSESNSLTPWMCTGDFAPALQAIAEFVKGARPGCITEAPIRCQGPGDTSCPSFPYQPGVEPTCMAMPNSGDTVYFCDSGVQVRIKPGPNPDFSLEETGFCAPDGIQPPDFPNGCIVARDRYVLEECGPNTRAIRMSWASPDIENDALNRLAGYTMEVRYAPGINPSASEQ